MSKTLNIDIPAATSTSAGVMSAAHVSDLEACVAEFESLTNSYNDLNERLNAVTAKNDSNGTKIANLEVTSKTDVVMFDHILDQPDWVESIVEDSATTPIKGVVYYAPNSKFYGYTNRQENATLTYTLYENWPTAQKYKNSDGGVRTDCVFVSKNGNMSYFNGFNLLDCATTARLEYAEGRIKYLATQHDSDKTNNDTKIASIETNVGEAKGQISNIAAELEELHQITFTDKYAYGIEWDCANTSSVCTRIGNMQMHRSLPIQNAIKGCLLDDSGNVVEWLPENDWTTVDRSGAKGQVMVRIPKHYYKFVKIGTRRQVWLSEYPLPDFHESKEFYVGAYEAAMQRSENKICSVVNLDPDFRGGNNDETLDADPEKTLLGKCVRNLTLPQLREYAGNRSKQRRWCPYTYIAHRTIFWLVSVEYATIDIEKPFNAEPTAEGYKQGGLTNGCGNLSYKTWLSTFKGQPICPIGHTDDSGNGTVVKDYRFGAYYQPVVRYRGMENLWDHIEKWLDGINCRDKIAYISNNPAVFSSETCDGYEAVYDIPSGESEGMVSDVLFSEHGDIFPITFNGVGNTTHYGCTTSTYGFSDYDNISANRPTIMGTELSTNPTLNNIGGPLCIDFGAYVPSTNVGTTHLCYIPE